MDTWVRDFFLVSVGVAGAFALALLSVDFVRYLRTGSRI